MCFATEGMNVKVNKAWFLLAKSSLLQVREATLANGEEEFSGFDATKVQQIIFTRCANEFRGLDIVIISVSAPSLTLLPLFPSSDSLWHGSTHGWVTSIGWPWPIQNQTCDQNGMPWLAQGTRALLKTGEIMRERGGAFKWNPLPEKGLEPGLATMSHAHYYSPFSKKGQSERILSW